MSEKMRVHRLGTYNSERGRGLVHTAGWMAHMEDEQRWFDEEYMPSEWRRMGYEPDPDSGPLTVYRKIKQPPFWKRWLRIQEREAHRGPE